MISSRSRTHRALCSSNKRAANCVSLGETDRSGPRACRAWLRPDIERGAIEFAKARPAAVTFNNGGAGAGCNVNAILPIDSAPLMGMQGWYDTVCALSKV